MNDMPTFHDLKLSAIQVFKEAMENTQALDTDDLDSVYEYLHVLQGHISACEIFAVAVALQLHKLERMEAMP